MTSAAVTAVAEPVSRRARRTVHVEQCMGTVFSLDIRDSGRWESAVADVVTWLHRADAIFSTYRPDSDISRMQREALRLADADPLVAEVLELCAGIESETRGFFTARLGRTIDPTGLVKGWAIERAGGILAGHGAANFAINGGGDVLLSGGAGDDEAWRVGIADPHHPGQLVGVVSGRDFAVATSGVSERGAHILDPFTGASSNSGLAAATVVGPSIVRADAYATAAFVMGAAAHPWLDAVDGYDLFTVARLQPSDGVLR